MVTIEKELEIIALNKLLNYIKFDCNDPDCLLFAASPLINEIYVNVQKEIRNIYSKKGYSYQREQNFIEENKLYVEHIKENIRRTNNWNELSSEIKKSYINDLIYPYIVKEETLNLLLEDGDIYHKA